MTGAAPNRALWDERVPIHVESDFYDVRGLAGGSRPLRPFELDEVGDVDGRARCSTPSATSARTRWPGPAAARRSPGSTSRRRRSTRRGRLPTRPGIDARRSCAPTCTTRRRRSAARTFDVVYTGLGAINWLADIDRWAATMASVCRPGGTFYLAEFHPFVVAVRGRRPGRRAGAAAHVAAAVLRPHVARRRDDRHLRGPRRGDDVERDVGAGLDDGRGGLGDRRCGLPARVPPRARPHAVSRRSPSWSATTTAATTCRRGRRRCR